VLCSSVAERKFDHSKNCGSRDLSYLELPNFVWNCELEKFVSCMQKELPNVDWNCELPELF
jgi:hypothetical protein